MNLLPLQQQNCDNWVSFMRYKIFNCCIFSTKEIVGSCIAMSLWPHIQSIFHLIYHPHSLLLSPSIHRVSWWTKISQRTINPQCHNTWRFLKEASIHRCHTRQISQRSINSQMTSTKISRRISYQTCSHTIASATKLLKSELYAECRNEET